MEDSEKMRARRIQMDNIVRMSSKKPPTSYFESIILRAQPSVYNKYKCIKIRFTKDLKRDVYYLCALFWHLGVVAKTVEKLPDGLQIDKGVVIGNAYEVTLEKIGAIRFEDNEEYNEWMREEWSNKIN